jgi:uncharacterized membrane protein
LIDIAGEDLDEQLQRVYAYAPSPEEVDPALITASQSGAVIKIRSALLVAAAQAASCRLEMLPAMGDFVPAGAALLRIHGDAGRLDGDRVADYVVLSDERTHEDDPAYGFRALVDIAERSIAQPFTDPTTAKQAIDRLHDALRQLAPRTIPTGRHYDEAGQLRLTVPTLGWHGFVRLAFDELRLAGSRSPQVTRRLQAALQDLKVAAPPERHPPLDEQLALLQAAVKRRVEGDEVAGALIADPQGIGSGTDLLVGAMPQKPTPRQEEN